MFVCISLKRSVDKDGILLSRFSQVLVERSRKRVGRSVCHVNWISLMTQRAVFKLSRSEATISSAPTWFPFTQKNSVSIVEDGGRPGKNVNYEPGRSERRLPLRAERRVRRCVKLHLRGTCFRKCAKYVAYRTSESNARSCTVTMW